MATLEANQLEMQLSTALFDAKTAKETASEKTDQHANITTKLQLPKRWLQALEAAFSRCVSVCGSFCSFTETSQQSRHCHRTSLFRCLMCSRAGALAWRRDEPSLRAADGTAGLLPAVHSTAAAGALHKSNRQDGGSRRTADREVLRADDIIERGAEVLHDAFEPAVEEAD